MKDVEFLPCSRRKDIAIVGKLPEGIANPYARSKSGRQQAIVAKKNSSTKQGCETSMLARALLLNVFVVKNV